MERRAQERITEKLRKYSVVSVIGLSKNVGKTTVVNFLLRRLSRACVITVGRDGEEEDKMFKNSKPPVILPARNFAVVPVQIMPYGVRILETLDGPSGKLSLVEALVESEVQTMRIGSYEETIEAIEKIKEYADKVIIDGALGRMGAMSVSEGVILVSGAEVGKSVEEIVSKTLTTVKKILTPQAPKNILNLLKDVSKEVLIFESGKVRKSGIYGVVGNENKIIKASKGADFIYLPGAVTEEVASHVKCPIIVPTSDKIFSNHGDFFVLKKTDLIGIALNHTSVRGEEVEPSELISELKSRLNDGIIVFDVLYDM